MQTVSVVYFSGYGHTQKQAEAVIKGLTSVADIQVNTIRIDQEGNITEAEWVLLANSDGIIFGSPTYMGNVAWQFKKFVDTSSKPWFIRAWQGKLSAGFTNSASVNGDKGSTITYLMTFAMQHGMLWTGTGIMPANTKASVRADKNFLGGMSGLLATSPSDSTPDEGPHAGDLDTAVLFGQNFVAQLKRLSPITAN